MAKMPWRGEGRIKVNDVQALLPVYHVKMVVPKGVGSNSRCEGYVPSTWVDSSRGHSLINMDAEIMTESGTIKDCRFSGAPACMNGRHGCCSRMDFIRTTSVSCTIYVTVQECAICHSETRGDDPTMDNI